MMGVKLRNVFAALTTLIILLNGASIAEIWQSYTSLDDLKDLQYHNGKLWGAAGGGIFQFSLSDFTFQIFTLADGFRGDDFSCLAIDNAGRIWSSGEGAVINIYQPSSNSNTALNYIAGEAQTVYDLAVDQSHVFAAADNGIYELTYNPEFNEYFVKGGYHQLGSFPVNSPAVAVCVFAGYLWAGNSNGIARIPLSIDNKQPPQNWENFTPQNGLPASGVNSFAVVDSTLYVSSQYDGIAKFMGDSFQSVPASNYFEINRIKYFNGFIYGAGATGIRRLENDSWVDVGEQIGSFYDVAIDPAGNIWGAKANGQYVKGGLKEFDGAVWNDFPTNTPAGKMVLGLITDSQNRIWCAGGPVFGKGVYVFDGSQWTNYTAQEEQFNVYFFTRVGGNTAGPRHLLEHPSGDVWVSSFGSGVGVFRQNGEVLYYNSIDSLSEDSLARLAGIEGDITFCVMEEMALDPEGNIWMLNSEAGDQNPLVMVPHDFMIEYSPNVEWLYFSTGDLANTFQQQEIYYYELAIDQQGRLWLGGNNIETKGIRCYDFKGTPYDKSDDESYLFTTSKGLLSLKVNNIAVDNENRLWAATDLGVNVMDLNLSDISLGYFDTPYFLEGIKTNCIAVDPMNNKWFGTNDGVLVFSADNYTVLEVYTAESYPLLNNEITTIHFDAAGGKALIGTNFGISTLLTPYRQFGQNLNSVEVYPAPFYPGEDQILRFSDESLTPDASVKIFTHTGLLVRKLSFTEASLGWDGKNSEGKFVSSGIYLILVTSPEGKSAQGKAAVLRR